MTPNKCHNVPFYSIFNPFSTLFLSAGRESCLHHRTVPASSQCAHMCQRGRNLGAEAAVRLLPWQPILPPPSSVIDLCLTHNVSLTFFPFLFLR